MKGGKNFESVDVTNRGRIWSITVLSCLFSILDKFNDLILVIRQIDKIVKQY